MTKHIRFVRQHKIKMNIGGVLIDPAGKEHVMKCKWCINNECELRDGIADDVSCEGTETDMIECTYVDDPVKRKVTTIVFVNENGDVDETQFDTQNKAELAEIWWDFCKENNIIIETIEEE